MASAITQGVDRPSAPGPGAVVRTRDVDELQEVLAFAAPHVDVAPIDRRFAATIRPAALPGVTMFVIDLSRSRITSLPTRGYGCYTVPLGAPLRTRDAGADHLTMPGQAHFLADGWDFDCTSLTAGPTFVANIDLDTAAETRRRLTGQAEAPWSSSWWSRPLASPEGARFQGAVARAWNLARSGEASEREAVEMAGELIEAAVGLEDPCQAVDSPAHRRDAVDAALGFAEAHLDEPLTLDRLCAVTDSSARTLNRGFRERVGASPMAFIKQQRLERAHRDLLATLPDETSVTRVAMRHGIGHLGRFSVDYRRAFGVSPSETLRA
jgi:AraC-like DNA-binding protein